MDSKQLGILGEKIALDYLKKKGYQILDRNYSNKFVSGPKRGEIDIVVKKGDLISFIEVKALSNQKGETEGRVVGGWRPEEKVDFQKQRKLMKTAQSWLMEKKIPLDAKWQIDIISIKIDPVSRKAKIRHFQNAVF